MARAVASYYKRFLFLEKLRGQGQGEVILKACKQNDRVLELVLNNPKSRNSMTGKMIVDMFDAISKLDHPQYRPYCALVVRGSGSTFCSGMNFDLAKLMQTPEEGELLHEFMTSTLSRLRNAPLISVSAIDGFAMGGGAEIATATDYRVMTETARVHFVEARMGISTAWGAATRLVKIVGRRNALKLLGTATPVNAQIAKEYRLVDHITTASDPVAGAMEFLAPYLRDSHPTSALRAIKAAVAGAHELSIPNAQEVERAAFRSTWATQENINAIQETSERIHSPSSRK